MGQRTWVRRRGRKLRQRRAHAGHTVSAPTVSRWLQAHDDAWRVHAQEQEARAHPPDRDPQCRDLEAQKQAFAAAGGPLSRGDTKQRR